MGGGRAGVAAGAIPTEATGAEIDRAGRISVLPDLSLRGHPEVFVVWDMISLNHLPGVGEVARVRVDILPTRFPALWGEGEGGHGGAGK